MNKSKVAIGVVSALIIATLAYSQLQKTDPVPQIKAESSGHPVAPVSKPAPTQSTDNFAPVAQKNHIKDIASSTDSQKNQQAISQQNKNTSAIRTTITPREQDTAKDHNDPRSKARHHGHEEHHDQNQPKRPPGEPKKAQSNNAPEG